MTNDLCNISESNSADPVGARTKTQQGKILATL